MMFRRFLIILVALSIIGVGVFFGFKVKKRETVYGALSTENIGKVNAILDRDTDGDGLKDWEEELWKTDRNNPDTDRDTTADGVEVASGRDPLKAGPDDKLDAQTVGEKTTLGLKNEPTLTDNIAQNLFGEYLKMKQSGQPLTADDERKLLLKFFNNPPPIDAVRLYERPDLTVSEAFNLKTLRTYGNEVAGIFKKYANIGENELNTITIAIEREDDSVLKDLDERIGVYKGMLNELVLVEVPEPFVNSHISLVNAMSGIAQSVAGMKFVISDPAKALASIGTYPHSFELLSNTFAEMKRIFTVHNVSFDPKEPGVAILE